MATNDIYGVAPACEGMSRRDITELLSHELVRLRLERRNAYSYWAHEVELSNRLRGGTSLRVDFLHFEPAKYHTCTDAGAIESGTFTAYEVKSCMADIRSGHGLNFVGDVNFLVMPVELYDPYKLARLDDDELCLATSRAGCLLYGKGKNGRGKFVKAGGPHMPSLVTRTRAASELLLCMMRAMIANSDHSPIDHPVTQ